ncbi:hypothetical protein POVCU2_0034530 [Plasmodium ovale curtisi]|uniref:Uncharacterized protein n=1 Tax=Plasmodium ovale curtisi TaxID=864141 RepID=A0A1A8W1Z4_PLAOA|nr:hypothetical protein POVCU2_0034530 [Plasmodium ovale curtisi]
MMICEKGENVLRSVPRFRGDGITYWHLLRGASVDVSPFAVDTEVPYVCFASFLAAHEKSRALRSAKEESPSRTLLCLLVNLSSVAGLTFTCKYALTSGWLFWCSTKRRPPRMCMCTHFYIPFCETHLTGKNYKYELILLLQAIGKTKIATPYSMSMTSLVALLQFDFVNIPTLRLHPLNVRPFSLSLFISPTFILPIFNLPLLTLPKDPYIYEKVQMAVVHCKAIHTYVAQSYIQSVGSPSG